MCEIILNRACCVTFRDGRYASFLDFSLSAEICSLLMDVQLVNILSNIQMMHHIAWYVRNPRHEL